MTGFKRETAMTGFEIHGSMKHRCWPVQGKVDPSVGGEVLGSRVDEGDD